MKRLAAFAAFVVLAGSASVATAPPAAALTCHTRTVDRYLWAGVMDHWTTGSRLVPQPVYREPTKWSATFVYTRCKRRGHPPRYTIDMVMVRFRTEDADPFKCADAITGGFVSMGMWVSVETRRGDHAYTNQVQATCNPGSKHGFVWAERRTGDLHRTVSRKSRPKFKITWHIHNEKYRDQVAWSMGRLK